MPPKNAPTSPASRTDAVTTPTAGTPVTAPVTPITPINPVPVPPVPVPPGGTAGGTTPTLSTSNPTYTGPSSTVQAIVPTTPGQVTFSLTVTDNLGQTGTAQVTVTVQGVPNAELTANPNPVAAGGTVQLSGAGSQSTGGGTITSYAFSMSATPAPTPVTPT